MFHFDLSAMKDEIADKENLSYKTDFWDDIDSAQKIMQKIKQLNNEVKRYEDLMTKRQGEKTALGISAIVCGALSIASISGLVGSYIKVDSAWISCRRRILWGL